MSRSSNGYMILKDNIFFRKSYTIIYVGYYCLKKQDTNSTYYDLTFYWPIVTIVVTQDFRSCQKIYYEWLPKNKVRLTFGLRNGTTFIQHIPWSSPEWILMGRKRLYKQEILNVSTENEQSPEISFQWKSYYRKDWRDTF